MAGGRVEVEFYNFFTVRTKKESTGKNVKKKKYAITNLCKNLFFVCGFFRITRKQTLKTKEISQYLRWSLERDLELPSHSLISGRKIISLLKVP